MRFKNTASTQLLSMLALTVLFSLALCLAHDARAVERGSSSGAPVTFHFYGADNCPPCQRFKRDGLPVVEASARRLGFKVKVNFIGRTRDIGKVGIYGPSDDLLRRAGQRMERVYPPVFFVTRGDRIVSVHDANWREALRAVETAARQAS